MITKEAARVRLTQSLNEVHALRDNREGRYSDTHMRWEMNVRNALEDIFGKESRYFIGFDSIPWERKEATGAEIIASFGVKDLQYKTYLTCLGAARGLLKSAIEYVDLREEGETSNYNFWSHIHPEVRRVSESRFQAGHLADSVEAAFKQINSIVKNEYKEKTGIELDGAKLMQQAFNLNNTDPIIALDDISTESGRNIQQGYMNIFAGAMTGIRNPKAHENLEIDKNNAIHLLFLASLLMGKIKQEKVIQNHQITVDRNES